MNYSEQLQHRLWKQKRELILKRDGYKCQNCYNKTLIDTLNISFADFGTTAANLYYLLIDKNTGEINRCLTSYDKKFDFKLRELGEEGSIIALSNAINGWVNLIATVVLKPKLSIGNKSTPLELLQKGESLSRQKAQEKALRNLDGNELQKLQWIDTKGLHIHHKYYQIGKLAWDYPDTALITLCWSCHEIEHINSEIDVLDENGNFVEKRQVCPKCYGAGMFPEYLHVQNGVCFLCIGNRFL